MKLSFACDHAGVELKDSLIEHLKTREDIEIIDLGVQAGEKGDYPIYAEKLGISVASGQADRGVLICGTGVGMSVVANKVPGVRAVVCSEPYSALMAREHNDSNVLCMGQRVVGERLAQMILDHWLDGEFQGDRHQRRVDIITEIEEKYSK